MRLVIYLPDGTEHTLPYSVKRRTDLLMIKEWETGTYTHDGQIYFPTDVVAVHTADGCISLLVLTGFCTLVFGLRGLFGMTLFGYVVYLFRRERDFEARGFNGSYVG